MNAFGLHVVRTLIHVNRRHSQSASLSNAFLSFAEWFYKIKPHLLMLSYVSYDQGMLSVGYQLCPYFDPRHHQSLCLYNVFLSFS